MFPNFDKKKYMIKPSNGSHTSKSIVHEFDFGNEVTGQH